MFAGTECCSSDRALRIDSLERGSATLTKDKILGSYIITECVSCLKALTLCTLSSDQPTTPSIPCARLIRATSSLGFSEPFLGTSLLFVSISIDLLGIWMSLTSKIRWSVVLASFDIFASRSMRRTRFANLLLCPRSKVFTGVS